MKTPMLSIVTAAVILSPIVVSAQTGDTAYCKALGDKYQTYVSNMQSGRSPMPESPDVRIAIDQCSKGNTAAGIPVLEQKLRNAKVDLPPRG